MIVRRFPVDALARQQRRRIPGRLGEEAHQLTPRQFQSATRIDHGHQPEHRRLQSPFARNVRIVHAHRHAGHHRTQRLENVLKPAYILASEMNGRPLTRVYGAPLRLRVENQLGYKMVKWIERIEFIESERQIGKGQGGKNEDDEYFDLLPNI
jgi:DMSO/TMAO reductase YedYZ molybdopterin-dependent catalytic subunit